MRTRSGKGAGRRFTTTVAALFAAAAAMALLIGPAQAAPEGCEDGYLAIDTIEGPVTAGTSFSVTVRALGCDDELLTEYDGSVTLSGNASQAPDLVSDPDYGDPLVFDGGVATTDATLYAAETGVQLTASDGDLLDGTSNAFDVVPAELDEFVIDPIANATAGDAFTVTVTALDEFENPKTDYTEGAVIDGAECDLPLDDCTPGTSPNGDEPSYGASGELDWFAGMGTADVTLFKAETGRKLSVEDAGEEVEATSNAFDVGPGPLAEFDIDPISNATAGDPFTVTVTAYDAFGNEKVDYDGTPTLDEATGFEPGDSPKGDEPVYGGLTFIGAEGTAQATLFKAETGRKLSVEDAGEEVEATSNAFDVGPGPLAEFDFDQVGLELGPPVHFVVEAATPFGVTLTAFDAFGNVKTNYDGVGAILSGDLEGTPTYGSVTWLDGVGTASVTATVHSIDRTLTVTDDAVTEDSNEFDVVADVCTDEASCNGSSGNGSKKVSLSTPLEDGTASIGFFNPPGGTIDCVLKDLSTKTLVVAGAISLVNPPPGYDEDNPLTLTMTLAKGVATTGPGNLIVCLSKNRGASFEQIVDCGKKFKKSNIPCITSRTRTGVGETVITALITSTDPWGGIS